MPTEDAHSKALWIEGTGYSSLHLAAYNGDLEGIQVALSTGAAVDQPDSIGNTALHWACFRSGVADQTPVVRALVGAGADVNAVTADGLSTPLILAVEARNRRLAELLLTLGARVDACPDEVTPLMLAAQEGDTSLVKLLLAHGADRQISSGRFVAADYARSRGHRTLARFIETSGK